MAIQSRKKTVSNRVDTSGVTVKAYRISEATPLVTLEDPKAPPETASGAFARLRPPEGLTPAEIDSWRDSVARHAKAVKVLPQPRAADVPAAAHRPDGKAVGSIREEALALATESGNKTVITMVGKILDEVGA